MWTFAERIEGDRTSGLAAIPESNHSARHHSAFEKSGSTAQTPEERREIAAKLHELEGDELTEEEKALLDRKLADYEANPRAGSTWNEVEARIRRGGKS